MAGEMTGAGAGDDLTNLGLVASEGLDFLISGEEKVPLSSIEQNTITCLYFSANWCRPCRSFNSQLVELYNTINSMDKKLEIIFISSDRNAKSFTEHYKHMPWLAAPFKAGLQQRLRNRYGVNCIPSLIPIALYGKTAEEDAVQLVGDYGVDAFPFSAQRREDLKAMDDAKSRGGSLLDLLGSSKRDYVVSKDGLMVPIADLVGKTIGLYFGAHWCPPCRSFTIMLEDTYNELRAAKNESFEIIFVSTDRDKEEFNLSLSSMPWFAIPYFDKTRHELSRIFDVKGIPTLVLLGPDGKPLGTDGRAMISSYGAKAFPFTVSRAVQVEADLKKEGEGLPIRVTDLKHDHELKLDMAKAYVCDYCGERGKFWVFSCHMCDYDLNVFIAFMELRFLYAL